MLRWWEEKGEEIWRSRMISTHKRETMQVKGTQRHYKNIPNTQRLRILIYLWRPVIIPVCLTYGLRAQPSDFPQRLCNQKDKDLKIYK